MFGNKSYIGVDAVGGMTPIEGIDVISKLGMMSKSKVINAVIVYGLDHKYLPKGKLVFDATILSGYEHTLPENLTLNGDMFQGDFELPNNLTIKGDLYVSKTATKLPSNLKVEGNVISRNSNLIEIPNDLVVNGRLTITHSKIEKIPFGLTVYGDFECSNDFVKLELEDYAKIGGRFTN